MFGHNSFDALLVNKHKNKTLLLFSSFVSIENRISRYIHEDVKIFGPRALKIHFVPDMVSVISSIDNLDNLQIFKGHEIGSAKKGQLNLRELDDALVHRSLYTCVKVELSAR